MVVVVGVVVEGSEHFGMSEAVISMIIESSLQVESYVTNMDMPINGACGSAAEKLSPV